MAEEYLDIRGRRRNLLRLARINLTSFLHLFFYRIVILFSIIAAAIIIASMVSGGQFLDILAYASIAIVWLLVTPQLFGTFKVLPIVLTNGEAMGRLNSSFLKFKESVMPTSPAYKSILAAFPYVAIIVWIALLALLLAMLAVAL